VYARSAGPGGSTFLVDGLWPRGVRKRDLAPVTWLPEVAPSHELREWFGHRPERWTGFQRRYRLELRAHPEAWQPLVAAIREGPIVLYYAARDPEHNNAVALRSFLLLQMRRSLGAIRRSGPPRS
jgi:uncharacterized protein YeaO (DUF488 family)